MIKVIAFYLPQFHSIPENDAVWGKGFTEWNNVRSGKPLVDGQYQPREPLNDNYYNLLDENTILWQTNLAKRNHVFGFCIYHYWFSGKILLNKPLELMKRSAKINFPYCICWANESWTNAWVATGKPQSFLQQRYGDKAEWQAHFDYLLQFFKDSNYILENNKPLFVIYRPETIPNLNQRLDFWDKLARSHGFDGMVYAYQQLDFELDSHKDDSRFTYSIEYQPRYALHHVNPDAEKDDSKALKDIKKFGKHILTIGHNVLGAKIIQAHTNNEKPTIESYQQLCNVIVTHQPNNKKNVGGMFVGYDDTPRRGNRGTIIQSTPEQFRKYFELQVKNIETYYSSNYLFLFAWNEWAEGGYLEPDAKYHYKYLNAIKETLKSENNLDKD